MKKLFILLTFFSLELQAKSLTCRHYLDTEIHGQETTIIEWYEEASFEIGANNQQLLKKWEVQKALAAKLESFLAENKKENVVRELSSFFKTPFNEKQDLIHYVTELKQKVSLTKTLIKEKDDLYSQFKLEFVSGMEIMSNNQVITEGLLFSLTNKNTKILSTYYHALTNDGLILPDPASNILGELKEVIAPLNIGHPQFGNLKAISYKCFYPSKSPTDTELEKEYLELKKNIEKKLKVFTDRQLEENKKINTSVKESAPVQDPGPAKANRN